MAREETYIGDGVYAHFNGQEIWLRADGEQICLDTGMLDKLQKMVKDYDPTPADDGRAWPQADNE